MANPHSKTCRVCGKDKPFSEFGKGTNCPDGFTRTCKQCAKERKGFRSTAKATCKNCQQIFSPRTGMQLYCSDECRLGDYRNQSIHTRVCKNCEKPFRKKHGSKYCSPQCRKEGRHKDTRTKEYRPRRNPTPIINVKRQCIDCGEVKPLDQFETKRDKRMESGYTTLSRCKPCRRLRDAVRKHLAKKSRGECGYMSAHIGEAIKGRLNWTKFKSIVGYDVHDLKRHLERQFTKGMSWDNYGDWHIDHIIPRSLFNPKNPDDVKACWALSNLRPLWAEENISKGAKQVFLL